MFILCVTIFYIEISAKFYVYSMKGLQTFILLCNLVLYNDK